ncbi:MAG: response regulator transcription factor [Actinobacteria bacterium]|nr:response regulator transcription factor [Actinomycetota bacterium]
MAKRTILLIEDEVSISEPLCAALERDGFDASVADSVQQGLELFHKAEPDLVLLDLMLPDGDGKDVLRSIRTKSRCPVIILTARGEEMDRVVGLELGADDYVTKPFSGAELLARVRAVLRRAVVPAPAHESRLKVGDIAMNLDTRQVTKDGRSLELTLKEFELLRMLMEEAGRVVRREEIIDEVWDPNWWGPTKTLDVHISSLRKKLEDDPAAPRYIHTSRGVGFRFASVAELGE